MQQTPFVLVKGKIKFLYRGKGTMIRDQGRINKDNPQPLGCNLTTGGQLTTSPSLATLNHVTDVNKRVTSGNLSSSVLRATWIGNQDGGSLLYATPRSDLKVETDESMPGIGLRVYLLHM